MSLLPIIFRLRSFRNLPPLTKHLYTSSFSYSNATPDAERTRFPGAIGSKYTESLSFIKNTEIIPTYRVLDTHGQIIADPNTPPDKDWSLKVYKTMLTLNIMDLILYQAQRQGRISFYMTSFGEEAIHMGSAAALDPKDWVLGQYRESGVLLYRGFPLDSMMNQCYSNHLDLGKGKQMPVHYGSSEFYFHTISSPLGTQIPQAVGVAYALKRTNTPNVAITYFGEGAASEGDFHAALSIASTRKCPVIFFCRNNGFAISTPVCDQYAGDGIASRGAGYGISTVRVDGNDVLAVYQATHAARTHALATNEPVLIEAMTYRVGHHSTSDDSSAYRPKLEADDWQARDNPVTRFRKYIESQSWWDQPTEDQFKSDMKKSVLLAFSNAEKRLKPSIRELFVDVFDQPTPRLIEQQNQLNDLIKKYPQFYQVEDYKV